MRKAQRRLWITLAAGVVLVGAAALAMTAMRDAMVFFYSPAMVAENGRLGHVNKRLSAIWG